jgi:hypothetical protein
MDRAVVEALRAEVRAALWELDPAGVSDDDDWPSDEYDSYVDNVVSALVNRGLEIAAIRLRDSLLERMDIAVPIEVLRVKLGRIDADQRG